MKVLRNMLNDNKSAIKKKIKTKKKEEANKRGYICQQNPPG